MAKVNLLDTSTGIQGILDQELNMRILPRAREMGANVMNNAGLRDLYSAVNTRVLAENALCPNVGDGTMLSPAVFSRNLQKGRKALAQSRNPKIRKMIRDELDPLLENKELLDAYLGLMIGG